MTEWYLGDGRVLGANRHRARQAGAGCEPAPGAPGWCWVRTGAVAGAGGRGGWQSAKLASTVWVFAAIGGGQPSPLIKTAGKRPPIERLLRQGTSKPTPSSRLLHPGLLPDVLGACRASQAPAGHPRRLSGIPGTRYKGSRVPAGTPGCLPGLPGTRSHPRTRRTLPAPVGQRKHSGHPHLPAGHPRGPPLPRPRARRRGGPQWRQTYSDRTGSAAFLASSRTFWASSLPVMIFSTASV